MLSKFDNQKYQGNQLPRFDEVQGVNSFDHEGEVLGKPSNIEIDALCRGRKNWIFEFKYRKKSVGKKDIEQLKRKRNFIESKFKIKIHKMVFIAKSGFSEYALQSDVWCLTMQDINKLLSLLNMKKVSEVFQMNDLERPYQTMVAK
jgi:hypothetical protein